MFFNIYQWFFRGIILSLILFLYLPYCGDTFAIAFYVWCYSDIPEPFPGGAKNKTQKVHFRQKFTFPFKCFYDFQDACEMFWKPPRTVRDHNLRVKVTTKFFQNFQKFSKNMIFTGFSAFSPETSYTPWDNDSNYIPVTIFLVCKDPIEFCSKYTSVTQVS